MALTYGGSGVDTAQISKSLGKIGRIIASTHSAQKKVTVSSGFGHYAGIVRIRGGPAIAVHTDGVGTKVEVACSMKKYSTIGVDCIAMNANDIICVGATPISFVDYIAASRNDVTILSDIARGLARGAKKARVPIVGGETAIMPGLFSGRGFSFDLAGTIVGLVPPSGPVLGRAIKPGDVIIGAQSSGLHSNGYTLARRALAKFPLNERVRGVGILGDALLLPTEIYVAPVLEILQKCKVHGLAHITGDSFAKLLRLKSTGYDLDSLPEVPPLMRLIADQGVAKTEMYKTFNMGVGFCVIAPAGEEGQIRRIFRRHRIASHRIGHIARKKGVYIGAERIA